MVEINKNAQLSQHLTSSSVAALGHSSELDGSHLTPHFTLGELCKTSVKTADGNIPSHVHIENLRRLCRWLERLRKRWNERYGSLTPNPSPKGEGNSDDPIVINSGYRSEAVNKAVGGAKGSNHLTGCAVDIRVAGMEQLLRYAVILLDIADEGREDFDELLMERNAKGTYWLHFAVRPEGNRRKIVFLRV
jgi:uncharacterized protein YcbK (DUF882 family)